MSPMPAQSVFVIALRVALSPCGEQLAIIEGCPQYGIRGLKCQGPATQAFLKPDVKIELLVGRWFAWPHLISPVQHAMNIAFRHLPLMQSFVANPQVHVAAAD